MKAKRRKRNNNKNRRALRQRRTRHHLQTARRIQVRAPLVASQLWRANQRASTLALGYPPLGLSRHVRAYTSSACRSPALAFSAAIHFAMMKRSAPWTAVLRHSPSSWAVVVYWSALMPKALKSSRKYPIHYFSWPPTQPAPLTNYSPNITHFDSLVSSMRATNPANKIRLRRKVASMLSLPVLISVSRCAIVWSARLRFRQPMQRVKKLYHDDPYHLPQLLGWLRDDPGIVSVKHAPKRRRQDWLSGSAFPRPPAPFFFLRWTKASMMSLSALKRV